MTEITIDPTGAPPVAPANGADLVIETTTQGFVADVLEESKTRPVLVDFWAPWCGPCRTLSPIIENAVQAANGSVKLVKMNIDDHPSIPGQLGIQSIPAVIAFVDGKPIDGFLGAIPEGEVKAFIEKVAGPTAETSGIADLLVEAEAALGHGNAERAAEIYAAVHESESDNLQAIAGLSRAAFALGDLARAKEALASAPAGAESDPLIAAARAEIELAEQTEDLGNPAELAALIEADPTDLAARFDLALVRNSQGDRIAAGDQLLSIIGADREWNDEQARKQLLQFFELWGPKDPATLAGRRRLSSLLFS